MPRSWSIERAQDAIKAAFVSRQIFPLGNQESKRLRYGEIKNIISKTEGSISDRTLSRALNGLLDMGKIRKQHEGKYSYYSLSITRSDKVKAYSRAESSFLEYAGSVGGHADTVGGWAVFGIPTAIPKKFISRFRTASKSHQEELRNILFDLWDECVETILEPVRNSVPKSVLRKGENALVKLLYYQISGIEGISRARTFWQYIENAAPGTLSAFRKYLNLNTSAETQIQDAIANAIAVLNGKSVEDIKGEVDEEYRGFISEIKSVFDALLPIWNALTKRERKKASRMLMALSQMTDSLVSVVHP